MAGNEEKSEDLDEKLIAEVQKYRNLYDQKQNDYKDREKTENTWKTIAEELETSSEFCKSRWKTLKILFARERAKRKNPSGAGSKRRQPWALFDHMSWIADFMQTRKRCSNVKSSSKSSNCVLYLIKGAIIYNFF